MQIDSNKDEIEMILKQIEKINTILDGFNITSKEDIDKMIQSNNDYVVQLTIDKLNQSLQEELKKVLKETDNLKVNLNDNRVQLGNLDANICKIIVQKADKHLVVENTEELKKVAQEIEDLKIQLSNLDANLIKTNDKKADLNYVNEKLEEIKKQEPSFMGTIEINKTPDLTEEFIKLRE